ncbi:hypothetical protein [Legionella sainthelensi]|uniref:hypothetical protein n=1 Tax=Legionella sainthelensi TaxID=28087 RepID=UPI0018D5A139|nr:hypothetical protein [Legionella sainthelensi]
MSLDNLSWTIVSIVFSGTLIDRPSLDNSEAITTLSGDNLSSNSSMRRNGLTCVTTFLTQSIHQPLVFAQCNND